MIYLSHRLPPAAVVGDTFIDDGDYENLRARSTTKADVGLGNVDNTSDADKPVSTAQQLELDAKVAIADIINTLTSEVANKPLSANMGKVLKGHIDNINVLLQSDTGTLDTLQEIVDYIQLNRADLDALGIASISGLQDSLNGKVDKVTGKGLSSNDYTTSEKNKLAGIEAGATADQSAAEIRDLLKTVDGSGSGVDADLLDGNHASHFATATALSSHSGNTNNPHGVTKSHVGLGNVDNTSDADKPVSTAQQTALDAKVATADIVNGLTSAATNKPLSANMGKALKGHIDNINALLQSDTSTLDTLQEIVDYIKLNRSDLEALGISSIAGLQSALNGKAPLSHNHSADDITSGTISLARLPSAAKVGDTTYTAGGGLSLTGTVFSVDNPFNPTGTYSGLRARGTTKADVGLGNVDNTSDADKPVSTAQQAALNGKSNTGHSHSASDLTSGTVPLARLPASAKIGDTTYTAGTGLNLSGTEFSVVNPFNPTGNYASLRARGTTKADVGLGNVPNLSGTADDTADTLMTRNSSGDTWARLFRSSYSGTNANIAAIYTTQTIGGDYMRPSTPAQVKASLELVKADVGLGNVDNYNRAHYDGRYLGKTGKAADADKLDGQDGSYYRNASNLNAGTVPHARLPNAAATSVGGVKVRLNGTAAYITSNGSNA